MKERSSRQFFQDLRAKNNFVDEREKETDKSSEGKTEINPRDEEETVFFFFSRRLTFFLLIKARMMRMNQREQKE